MMYQQFENERMSSLVQIGRTPVPSSSAKLLDAYTLRISVLEQCHYRCPYCQPAGTKPFHKKKQWLTADEHRVLAHALSPLPIHKIRFTGGEPLLRPDLADLIQGWRTHFPHATLALTTNGDKMLGKLPLLESVGLDQLTFHLDTLKAERYAALMGRGDFEQVLLNIHESQRRLSNTKINMVVQKGLNDDELIDFIDFSSKTGIQVRFIELMDTGSAPEHVQKTFISQKELLARLNSHFVVEERARKEASDPAALFYVPSKDVTFGMIASDTEPFCSDCNRLRLSADGALRGCLYEPDGIPLKGVLDKKLPIEDLRSILKQSILQKTSYHPAVGLGRVPFSMAQVGG
jgi:GTP 3',8-cyclase